MPAPIAPSPVSVPRPTVSTSPAPAAADAPPVDDAATRAPQAPAAPEANVLIAKMKVQADLTDEAQMARGPERKAAVYEDLVQTARTSQVEAIAKLEELSKAGDVTSFESLFMPNAILVTTKPGRHQAVQQALAGVANVAGVSENKTWSVQGSLDGAIGASGAVSGSGSVGTAGAAAGAAMLAAARAFQVGGSDTSARGPRPRVGFRPVKGEEGPLDTEWGVNKIGAPAAWAAGYDGSGVTVGIVDTGLDASHPAIAPHYRGTAADGSQVHDYHWFDPFQRRATPYDDGDHGTHVAGTTAGGTDSRAIGVAPGARIIAAKAINGSGYNTTSATLQALQFMLAPTKTDGTAPDPTKGADVVNNSWGNANQADDNFMDSFEALKAAGIEVVSSAGNNGPSDGTVSPPGSYPGYLSVAATTERDGVANFSSRGPSRFATPEDMTPNVAAPGAGVNSSVPGGGFRRMSGTSMASPHVAGAVAVLLQAHPQATHQQIVDALTRTAVDIDKKGPDNAAGFGRIHLPAAIAHLQHALQREQQRAAVAKG